MKNLVIKYALSYMDKDELIKNLLDLNPGYFLIERLINGVHVPTPAEFISSRECPTRNVKIEHESDFEELNLFISYDYVQKLYCNQHIEGIIDNGDEKKLNTSWRQDEEHPFEIEYWAHASNHFASESFLKIM